MKTAESIGHRAKSKRQNLLGAVFSKASKIGISQEELRESIAPNVIGKRLSAADNKEIFKVLEHLVKLSSPSPLSPPVNGGEFSPSPLEGEGRGEGYKYASSKKGLLQELEDAAKQRWGADFQHSLNAFVNSHLKTLTHYKFLNVGFLKRIKERIKELNKLDSAERLRE